MESGLVLRVPANNIEIGLPSGTLQFRLAVIMFVGEFFFESKEAAPAPGPIRCLRVGARLISFLAGLLKRKNRTGVVFRETRGYIQIEWKISVARSHRRRNKIREIRANTIKSHPRRQTPASSNKNCVNFILHGSEPSQGIRVWSFGRADLFLVHFSPQLWGNN